MSFNASLSLRAQFVNRTASCVLGLWLRDGAGGGRQRRVLLGLAAQMPGAAVLRLLEERKESQGPRREQRAGASDNQDSEGNHGGFGKLSCMKGSKA